MCSCLVVCALVVEFERVRGKGGNREGGKERTYQSMGLRLLEIITPIQRIEPRVQEELRPLPVLKHEAAGT